jgi:tetratricopeptide (TPR) repeat protein
MSNVFKKERECYQNIIDFIIEPNENFLSEEVEEKIDVLREKKLPPHKEYTKSLRIILNDFPGDIVIILDEIDALKTAEYSDNIFAQIRSNYFTRTNFPEFERLTYVLSGVIEPIELIKDRNKSPFNIGDKIYLDDFNKPEFLEFIKMSQLTISDEMSTQIYNWTNGNPRLTFDICAEVENILLEELQIDLLRLEKLINDKYLTSYDHAPVDHIRELVTSNKDARNALIGLHEHTSISLTDAIKKKLYLFGIITSSFNEDTEFKNPIIKKSLSLKWLKSLQKEDDKKKFTLPYGLASFDNSEFDHAVEVFEYILSEKKDDAEEEDIRFFLGRSYFALGQTKQALEHLSYHFTKADYRSSAICVSGICKLRQGNREEGLIDLESVINDDDSFASNNALLNLARSLENKESERALELLHRLDCAIENEKNKTLKVASFYSQYEIYFQQRNTDKAIEALSEALNYSSPSEGFAIKLEMYSKNGSHKNKVDIVSTVIDNELIFNDKNELNLNFNEPNFIKCLSFVYDKHDSSLFNSLINYAVTNLRIDEQKKYELIFNAGIFGKGNEDILLELLPQDATINVDLSLKLYRRLAIYNQNTATIFIDYFTKFDRLSKNLVTLSEVDIYLYGLALEELFQLTMFKQILDISSDIEYRLTKQSCIDTMLLTSSTIYFWKGAVFSHLGQQERAIEYFKKTSSIIRESKYEDAIYFKRTHFSSLAGYELKIKAPVYNTTTLIQKKKFVHPAQSSDHVVYTQKQLVQVKYLDGTIKSGKYKKFANDIKTLKCEVIEA